ncbi:hypothetical protein PC129_g2612 [Phytophthora cactorum]|uniref:Secreted protein n=1 Tax=Phytophthora cactorum TaxID=29920 RepID=A0A8T1LVA6_9STRA|nr:hypothetical protein Pcac1_g10195 [Phytophthora cactorum]KAG2840217.1 hypothetical protein PC111_g3592 [Phytophthora cactorum]KAG2846554.1 hypothetical protein PC112_g1419 [Phytophthora cactorum]KAG2868880.1 hypothetical protein PC113_g709 [Phytophthora cactorum]KAG2928634.1 hypothetical protein PC114_g3082 [Phytophthora cactorum]
MKGKKKLAALSVVLAVVAGLASDKRRWPKKPSRRFSVRNTTWQRVLHDPASQTRWPSVRPAPRHNAHFPIRDRVAVAFY